MITATMLLALSAVAQDKVITNKYAMKMTDNGDGTYTFINAKKYARIMDISSIPDVNVPYTYTPHLLKSKDYKGVRTQDIVYKKHEGYELKLTIDFAETAAPAPFMIYVHGGGWARGNNGSSKSLSQYLAKQKGITGVRVEYSLAPQSGATIEVSIQDIKDALAYVQQHAQELNINPDVYGFLGTSAGGHLAGVGAMSTQAKVFVGYSGIYDLETAAIVQKTKNEERINYFCQRANKVLSKCSPINLIPKKAAPASMLVCGTLDVTVECEQSEMMAKALKKQGADCELLEYQYYDHNLSSKTSDKMEEIFFKTVDFIVKHLTL